MNNSEKPSRLAYSVAEAAEVLSISRAKLYLLLKSGVLVRRKIGTRSVILADDITAFVESLPRVEPGSGAERQ